MSQRNERDFEQLLFEGPIAVNLGLREFAESLQEQDVEVLHVEWSLRYSPSLAPRSHFIFRPEE